MYQFTLAKVGKLDLSQYTKAQGKHTMMHENKSKTELFDQTVHASSET